MDNFNETAEYSFGDCVICVERVFGEEAAADLLVRLLIEQAEVETGANADEEQR